jgi:hypothetical protein
MTNLPEIWNCIKSKLPKGKWISLKDKYQIVERNLKLDKEDYDWQ